MPIMASVRAMITWIVIPGLIVKIGIIFVCVIDCVMCYICNVNIEEYDIRTSIAEDVINASVS